MEPDAELNALCQQMSLAAVSRERIEMEFVKLFLKSRRPSLGLRWLDCVQRLAEILPEVHLLHGVQQQPQWHPEGDVFEHTMQAVDAAAALTYESEEQKLVTIYAALVHDCGKAITTKYLDGRWRSFGHEIEGVDLAQKLMQRICLCKRSIEIACPAGSLSYWLRGSWFATVDRLPHLNGLLLTLLRLQPFGYWLSWALPINGGVMD